MLDGVDTCTVLPQTSYIKLNDLHVFVAIIHYCGRDVHLNVGHFPQLRGLFFFGYFVHKRTLIYKYKCALYCAGGELQLGLIQWNVPVVHQGAWLCNLKSQATVHVLKIIGIINTPGGFNKEAYRWHELPNSIKCVQKVQES